MKLENDVFWSVGTFLENDNPKSYDAVHIRKMKDNDPQLKLDFENSQHGLFPVFI